MLKSSREKAPKMTIRWSDGETLALLRAWEAETRGGKRANISDIAFNAAIYHRYCARMAEWGVEPREARYVLAKRLALATLFERIREFNKRQLARNKPSWFELPVARRRDIRSRWELGKTTLDMSYELYSQIARVFNIQVAPNYPTRTDTRQTTSGSSSSSEQWGYSERWSDSELMSLARAYVDTKRSYRNASANAIVSKSTRHELQNKFQEFGGSSSRSVDAVARQTRYMLTAYRFITAFNKRAIQDNSVTWFQLSTSERRAEESKMPGNPYSLRYMDAVLFSVLQGTSTQAKMVHYTGDSSRQQRRSTTHSSSYLTSVQDSSPTTRIAVRQLFQQMHNRDDDSNELSRPAKKRRATDEREYQAFLEQTVVTMSQQLGEMDRRLTEARIQQNQHVVFGVLDACRRSHTFGSSSSMLARELLAHTGTNALQIANVAKQQQERDINMLHRLVASLPANPEGSF